MEVAGTHLLKSACQDSLLSQSFVSNSGPSFVPDSQPKEKPKNYINQVPEPNSYL